MCRNIKKLRVPDGIATREEIEASHFSSSAR
jgi:hypothetical protein